MINRLFLIRLYRKLLRPFRSARPENIVKFSSDKFPGPVLVAIAHPDDEVFCSGLICALREKDIPVSILCFTRGEGGDRGSLSPDEHLGSARENEMKAAASVLGVTKVTFLDYVDPPIAGNRLLAPQVQSTPFEQELLTHIESAGAKTIITHGSSGEYWHPAHYCLHEHIHRALHGKDTAIWTFNAWNPEHALPSILNRDDVPTLSVDGSLYHDQRLQSLQCHLTQHSVFERFSNDSLASFIELTSQEHYKKL